MMFWGFFPNWKQQVVIYALLFLDAAVLWLSVASKGNCLLHAIDINHFVMELETAQCYTEGNWDSGKNHGACPVSLPNSLNFCELEVE